MSDSEPTILILGGGIVGLCCALRLQMSGHRTIIVDPGDFTRAASSGNAGHIAIEQVEPLASPAMLRSAFTRLTAFGGPLSLPLRDIAHWAPFTKTWLKSANTKAFEHGKTVLGDLLSDAMPAWRRLVTDLARPDLLREHGHIIVWQNPVRAEHDIAAWQRAATGTARFHRAEATELRALADALHLRLAGALIFENTGQITNLNALFEALTSAYRAAGGRHIAANARSMTNKNGITTVTLSNAEQISANTILVTAGIGSGTLLRSLGQKIPLIAERGYHIRTQDHDWPADLPPVVFQERSIIVTRFETGLQIAGFVEFSRADARPDRQKWRRLQHHAAALGIPIRQPSSRWVGSRPTLPDYLPAIGHLAEAPGIFYAFGHQHLGLTLAPTTAEHMLGLINGTSRARPALSLSRFDCR